MQDQSNQKKFIPIPSILDLKAGDVVKRKSTEHLYTVEEVGITYALLKDGERSVTQPMVNHAEDWLMRER